MCRDHLPAPGPCHQLTAVSSEHWLRKIFSELVWLLAGVQSCALSASGPVCLLTVGWRPPFIFGPGGLCAALWEPAGGENRERGTLLARGRPACHVMRSEEWCPISSAGADGWHGVSPEGKGHGTSGCASTLSLAFPEDWSLYLKYQLDLRWGFSVL